MAIVVMPTITQAVPTPTSRRVPTRAHHVWATMMPR